MSDSKRDKRAWKARNPEKFLGEDWKENSESEKKFYSLFPTNDFPSIAWSIAGKRRRNSCRKSNQKTKPMIRQMDRAKGKEETLKEIKNERD